MEHPAKILNAPFSTTLTSGSQLRAYQSKPSRTVHRPSYLVCFPITTLDLKFLLWWGCAFYFLQKKN
ncbi:predicted protein [Nematostella vectensis]|uniref:Uncharacterized protein n=1 Tax=Nematostella vectensis TaxID=45351 RepID=A7T3K2_NEMVE|nr:predicted protein [Nematostella vectensis]|eukprot:XP_001621566.1 hypothetical protein NEMVEDRAFT_v1g233829 [Nematostella vectensis]